MCRKKLLKQGEMLSNSLGFHPWLTCVFVQGHLRTIPCKLFIPPPYNCGLIMQVRPPSVCGVPPGECLMRPLCQSRDRRTSFIMSSSSMLDRVLLEPGARNPNMGPHENITCSKLYLFILNSTLMNIAYLVERERERARESYFFCSRRNIGRVPGIL